MKRFDYIIIGQGLAGTALAISLLREKKSVLIIDDPFLSSSSKVAAGLYQPMTFKRTVETWEGLNSITLASEFYRYAENLLGENFFYPLKMYRMFSSYEEQNNWSLKVSEDRFSSLIGEERNEEADSCQPAFGYGSVSHAGYLDIPKLLEASCKYFDVNGSLLKEKVNYDDLQISNEEVIYKDFSASKVIFCEGWLIKENPWFAYVPMKPVKGEVLSIELTEKKFSSIISGGLFCVPRNEGGYKVGSNYDWNNLNEQPSETIKASFVNEISSILHTKAVTVLDHVAGVRPASHDRRPIIGCHPQYSNMILFNGLGARGVALAPFTVRFLVDHLLHQSSIPTELDVKRFTKYFHL